MPKLANLLPTALVAVCGALGTPALAQADQAQIDQAAQSMTKQLVRWSARIDSNGRLETCKTITSSGDPKLDALACQAMSDCVIKMQSVTARLEDPAVADAEKEKLAGDAGSMVTTCVENRRSELFRGLAESRAAEGKK